MNLVRILLAALLLTPAVLFSATRGSSLAGMERLETGSLNSISAWLKESGRDGYLAADVADAADIPRGPAEQALEARQRGFKSGEVLHIAQVPADEQRDFLLFMVQQPSGEVYFFVSSISTGLRKAFVSLPKEQAVLPLEDAEAQRRFQQEIRYWENRIAGG